MQNFFGISAQYLGTIENGENCLSVEKLIDLSNKTNLSLDYILVGKTSAINEDIFKQLANIKNEQIEDALDIVRQTIIILKNDKGISLN